MARVSFEESGFAAAKLIAKDTGIDRQKVIGMLLELWHDSQSLEKTRATESDMASWMGVDAKSFGTVFDALAAVGLIKYNRGNTWEISGNDKHIKSLRLYKDKGKRGGIASGESRKPGVEAHASKKSKRTVEAQVEPYSILSSSVLGYTEKRIHSPAKPGGGYSADFEKTWMEFLKIGKKLDAWKAFRELNLQSSDLALLSRAISIYLADCKRENRKQMYFGTFLREDWREWLNKKSPQQSMLDQMAQFYPTPKDSP